MAQRGRRGTPVVPLLDIAAHVALASTGKDSEAGGQPSRISCAGILWREELRMRPSDPRPHMFFSYGMVERLSMFCIGPMSLSDGPEFSAGSVSTARSLVFFIHELLDEPIYERWR